jgi:zinc protease
MAFEKLLEISFKNHRIRRFRTGYPEDIKRYEREHLLKWYKKYYCPNNVILVISGDIDDEIISLVDRYYGKEPCSIKREPQPKEEEEKGFDYKKIEADIKKAELLVGFHGAPFKDPDRPALEVLAALLGKGKSSRLVNRLKERDKTVFSISAAHYSLPDVGIFYIRASLDPENIEEAEEGIFQEIEKIKKYGVGRDELALIRNVLESQFILSLESNLEQAEILAKFESLGGWELVNEYLSSLLRVDGDDIKRVANKYLRLEKASILEYVPRGSRGKVNPDELFERLTLSSRNVEGKYLKGDLPPTKPPPLFFKITGRSIPDTLKIDTLPNGLTLLIKVRRGIPTISLGIFFSGGKIEEDTLTFGITHFSQKVAVKATEKFPPLKMARFLDSLGTDIDIYTDEHFFGFTITSLSSNWRPSLEVLGDVVLSASFPEEEVEKERRILLSNLIKREDKMSIYPIDLLKKVFFDTHPYGTPILGTKESLMKIGREKLIEWYRTHTDPKNALLIAIGDLDPDSIISEADRIFKEWTGRGKKFKEKTPSPPDEKRILKISREKKQTAVAIGFPAPPRNHYDFYPFLTLTQIFSGMSGRLWKSLREERGLAYSVYARMESEKRGGIFYIYFATSPGKYKEALSLALKEILSIRDSAPSIGEVENAKNYLKGRFLLALETNREQVLEYATAWFLGLGIDEISSFPNKIDMVTPEKVRRVALKYLRRNLYALGVVEGKESDSARKKGIQ